MKSAKLFLEIEFSRLGVDLEVHIAGCSIFASIPVVGVS